MIRPWTEYSDMKAYITKQSKVTESGCWEWPTGPRRGGYAEVLVRGKKRRLHRVSYEEFKGPIPKGKRICHHCDNPRCVNPGHLYIGTAADNANDVKERGNPRSYKLKKEDVEEIKRLYQAGADSMNALARKFKVTAGLICRIIHGKTWKGVGLDLWGDVKIRDKAKAALGNVKLTREQVVEVRDLLAAGVTQDEIAGRFGVSRRSIYAIREGETWRE